MTHHFEPVLDLFFSPGSSESVVMNDSFKVIDITV